MSDKNADILRDKATWGRIFIFANSGFNFRTRGFSWFKDKPRSPLCIRLSNSFIKNIHLSDSRPRALVPLCLFRFPRFFVLVLPLLHMSPSRHSSFPLLLSLPRISSFFPPVVFRYFCIFTDVCNRQSASRIGSESTLQKCASSSSILDRLAQAV